MMLIIIKPIIFGFAKVYHDDKPRQFPDFQPGGWSWWTRLVGPGGTRLDKVGCWFEPETKLDGTTKWNHSNHTNISDWVLGTTKWNNTVRSRLVQVSPGFTGLGLVWYGLDPVTKLDGAPKWNHSNQTYFSDWVGTTKWIHPNPYRLVWVALGWTRLVQVAPNWAGLETVWIQRPSWMEPKMEPLLTVWPLLPSGTIVI